MNNAEMLELPIRPLTSEQEQHGLDDKLRDALAWMESKGIVLLSEEGKEQ